VYQAVQEPVQEPASISSCCNLTLRLQEHHLCVCLFVCMQLVERAVEWASRLKCEQDVQFVHSNATISLASMLSSYPGRSAQMFVCVCLSACVRACTCALHKDLFQVGLRTTYWDEGHLITKTHCPPLCHTPFVPTHTHTTVPHTSGAWLCHTHNPTHPCHAPIMYVCMYIYTDTRLHHTRCV
jgi:hypothetical protein